MTSITKKVSEIFFLLIILVVPLGCVTYEHHFGRHRFSNLIIENDSITVVECKYFHCPAVDTFWRLHYPGKNRKIDWEEARDNRLLFRKKPRQSGP